MQQEGNGSSLSTVQFAWLKGALSRTGFCHLASEGIVAHYCPYVIAVNSHTKKRWFALPPSVPSPSGGAFTICPRPRSGGPGVYCCGSCALPDDSLGLALVSPTRLYRPALANGTTSFD